ncbi:MAG: nicotinate-nucleotide diphosphorylase (carboxylating) [Cellvibrionales bacterium TMED49]|nr:nicotinate-nucleotide diphosphorylase (carboxylating) [Porticoccaceae bacterium]OUU38864.1 MAG: nicotinate-nucleotide diphosphorylase (carboxylating) [Cellvibrionales bacterium TMED49]
MLNHKLPKKTELDIPDCVSRALSEDIGAGDISAMLVPECEIAEAEISANETAVLCGKAWVTEVFTQLDENVQLIWHVEEGQSFDPGAIIASITGNARSLVSAERTALNFLQTLSATATSARRYSLAASKCRLKILDTRKTIPGLRLAQKYAVTVGGCYNHRIGLYDAFLIKENHISVCGGITQAVSKARLIDPSKTIQVEVETVKEFEEAVFSGADAVLLDNFSLSDLQRVNSLVTDDIKIEISGNLTAEDIEKYSRFPISHLSSGSLTKHINAIDLSMRIVSVKNNKNNQSRLFNNLKET